MWDDPFGELSIDRAKILQHPLFRASRLQQFLDTAGREDGELAVHTVAGSFANISMAHIAKSPRVADFHGTDEHVYDAVLC